MLYILLTHKRHKFKEAQARAEWTQFCILPVFQKALGTLAEIPSTKELTFGCLPLILVDEIKNI